MSEAISTKPTLCGVDVDNLETSYDQELEDDEVAIKLSHISNTLDPVSFYDALVTEAAISEYKTSIGMTSTAMYDDEDDFYSVMMSQYRIG